MSTQKTVLVVDDDHHIRTISMKLIEKRGHRVVPAESGVQALDVLATTKVDLVILDVMMPVMDGFTALAEMRKRGHTNIPVVMLTAASSDEQVLTGYQSGADYYLTKPIRAQGLLNIVDFLIGDLSPEERAKLEALI